MAGGTLVNLAGEVLARAAELPDRQAVQEIATGRSLTFGELKAAAERLGSGLSSAGFDRGARVGIGLPNSLEWVLAVAVASPSCRSTAGFGLPSVPEVKMMQA